MALRLWILYSKMVTYPVCNPAFLATLAETVWRQMGNETVSQSQFGKKKNKQVWKDA